MKVGTASLLRACAPLLAAWLLIGAGTAQEPEDDLARALSETGDSAHTGDTGHTDETDEETDAEDSDEEDTDDKDTETEETDAEDSEPEEDTEADEDEAQDSDLPDQPPPPPASIRALRKRPPAKGATVDLAEVIVIARGELSVWVQDPDGARGSGLHLLAIDGAPKLPVGAHVAVHGTWSVHPHGVELLIDPGGLIDLGTRSVPTAAVLPTRVVQRGASATGWSDQLVTVHAPRIEALGPRGPLLGPPPAGLVLGRSLYDPGPLPYRSSWTALTGVLVNAPSGPQLWPRSAADLHEPAPAVLPSESIPTGALRLEELHPTPLRGPTGACAGGEYIELRNVSDQPIDLDGLYLWDAALRLLGEPEQIRHPLPIAPGQLALGVRRGADCYGLKADFSFDFELTDDGDHLQLFHRSAVLAELDYADWKPLWQGAAMQLDPRRDPARTVGDRAGWCLATEPIAPGADLGSPGRDNPPCKGWRRPER